jgi:hypothetical protein
VTSSETNSIAVPTTPTITGTPVITGNPIIGTSISTSSTGLSYTNSGTAPTYQYQWQSAATANGTYADITGANTATYSSVAASLKGQYIKVKVTASGFDPAAGLLSAAIGPVGYSIGFGAAVSQAAELIAEGTGLDAMQAVKYTTVVDTSAKTIAVTLTNGKLTNAITVDADASGITTPTGASLNSWTAKYQAAAQNATSFTIVFDGASATAGITSVAINTSADFSSLITATAISGSARATALAADINASTANTADAVTGSTVPLLLDWTTGAENLIPEGVTVNAGAKSVIADAAFTVNGTLNVDTNAESLTINAGITVTVGAGGAINFLHSTFGAGTYAAGGAVEIAAGTTADTITTAAAEGNGLTTGGVILVNNTSSAAVYTLAKGTGGDKIILAGGSITVPASTSGGAVLGVPAEGLVTLGSGSIVLGGNTTESDRGNLTFTSGGKIGVFAACNNSSNTTLTSLGGGTEAHTATTIVGTGATENATVVTSSAVQVRSVSDSDATIQAGNTVTTS